MGSLSNANTLPQPGGRSYKHVERTGLVGHFSDSVNSSIDPDAAWRAITVASEVLDGGVPISEKESDFIESLTAETAALNLGRTDVLMLRTEQLVTDQISAESGVLIHSIGQADPQLLPIFLALTERQVAELEMRNRYSSTPLAIARGIRDGMRRLAIREKVAELSTLQARLSLKGFIVEQTLQQYREGLPVIDSDMSHGNVRRVMDMEQSSFYELDPKYYKNEEEREKALDVLIQELTPEYGSLYGPSLNFFLHHVQLVADARKTSLQMLGLPGIQLPSYRVRGLSNRAIASDPTLIVADDLGIDTEVNHKLGALFSSLYLPSYLEMTSHHI